MSNIIKFPNVDKSAKTATTNTGKMELGARIKWAFKEIYRIIWVVTVLFWPILKWVLSIEVFFQFVRMIYYWNSPNVQAGWTFLLHFTILTAITCFVSSHKPKRI